jgi:hypothetical protein
MLLFIAARAAKEREMVRKVVKGLFAIGAGAVMLAASPASAGVVIQYYSSAPPNGVFLGYQIYCDSGALYEEWGSFDGVAIFDFVSVPC